MTKVAHKWMDVKDYLIHRSTGNYTMTADSANLTFVYDTRKGRQGRNLAARHTILPPWRER